jgi:CDP-paratose synthetase
MNGKKILVTGASGFIGRHLVNGLIAENSHALAITTRDRTTATLIFSDNVSYIEIDNVDFKKNIVSFSPDIVIHLASYSTNKDDISTIKQLIDANILFLSVLLDAVKDTKASLFLNTGSFAEYFYNDGALSPVYYYAATKTASRSILKYYSNLTGIKHCTIVPYTVYGGINKSKKIIDFIFDSLEASVPIAMSKGEQISDFVHIDDLVSFYLHILNNTSLLKDADDYHVGSGKGSSLRDVADLVEKISGKKTNIDWGALDYRPLDMMRAIAPIYKLEKELNWNPKIGIQQGLKLLWSKTKE